MVMLKKYSCLIGHKLDSPKEHLFSFASSLLNCSSLARSSKVCSVCWDSALERVWGGPKCLTVCGENWYPEIIYLSLLPWECPTLREHYWCWKLIIFQPFLNLSLPFLSPPKPEWLDPSSQWNKQTKKCSLGSRFWYFAVPVINRTCSWWVHKEKYSSLIGKSRM